MSVLPAALVALVAGCLSLGLRRSPRTALLVGLIGLALVAVAAVAVKPGDQLSVGGETIMGTAFLRLFLALGATAGLLLAVVGAATGSPRSLPGSWLLGLAVIALGLSTASPTAAIAVLTAGSIVGVISVARQTVPARVAVAARGLRAVVVASLLALLAVAWGDSGAAFSTALGPQGGAGGGPILGLAYLAAVAGVALRSGAVPVNAWAARFVEVAPSVAIPIVMAWGPAALAVVILGWTNARVGAFGAPLELERAVIALTGAASIVLGAIAAHLHDDVEHIVGYSLVQDAGVVLLGLGTLDPTAPVAARAWILAYVVVKSAFGAWAAAVSSTFGTRRLSELGGWVRRSPVLGVALLLIAVGSVGLPGFVAFDARLRLIGLTLGWPINLIVYVGAIGALGYYARIFAIGLARPSLRVALGAGARPRWPGGVRGRISPALLRDVPAAWRVNRAPIAAALVLVLASLGVATAAGGLDAAGAAREAPFAGGGAPGPGVP